MSLAVHREKGRLVFRVSKALYEKEAIFAATYALSGRCRNRIEPEPEGYVTVTLEPIDNPGDADLDDLEHRFTTEIVDQQFRLDLERRFGGLRRLIVQHAFTPLAHLQEEVKKTAGRD
jgi:His-Xaa-Ser system protein HxsD